MNEVEITHYPDEDLTPIVSVPLTNSKRSVLLYQDDFNTLMDLGVDPRWKLVNGVIYEKGGTIAISRLVADTCINEKVSLRDGDPCNLKRDNLVKYKGGRATESARDKLARSPKRNSQRPANLSLAHTYINPRHMEAIQ